MASTRMGARQAAIPGYRLAGLTQRPHSVAITSRCCQVFVAADGRECQLAAQDGRGGGAEVILISTGAEADYIELIDESPAAGFLAKSELSVRDISRILDHTP